MSFQGEFEVFECFSCSIQKGICESKPEVVYRRSKNLRETPNGKIKEKQRDKRNDLSMYYGIVKWVPHFQAKALGLCLLHLVSVDHNGEEEEEERR